MSKNILGALCMVASVTFFSLMDIIVKVTDDYAVGEILFDRYLLDLQGAIVLFFVFGSFELRWLEWIEKCYENSC